MMDNIEYLIEGDGFQQPIYLSTGVHLGQVNGILHRTPWDNLARRECLVKTRDGPDSGAKVDIFPVTKSSACKIENGTETMQDCQDCDGYERNTTWMRLRFVLRGEKEQIMLTRAGA